MKVPVGAISIILPRRSTLYDYGRYPSFVDFARNKVRAIAGKRCSAL